MWCVIWCALVLGACVEANVVQCPDGTICPAQSVCGEAPTRCISATQLGACEGKLDGDLCMLPGGDGECIDGVCEVRFCGDGIKSLGEACDGDDLGGADCGSEGFYAMTTGLACNADCTLDTTGCNGTCGDAAKNGSELCDHDDVGTATCLDAGFYKPEGLGCSAFCVYDVSGCSERCGDLLVNGPEVCDGSAPPETCYDLGLDAGLVGCSTSCGFDFGTCARFGFKPQPSAGFQTCNVMMSSSPTDIWIGRDSGLAHHFDGTQWTSQPTGQTTGTVIDMEVFAPTDAWAVHSNGVVTHWNGSALIVDGNAPAGANNIWASGPSDVWISTDTGEMHHFNGTWSQIASPGRRHLRRS